MSSFEAICEKVEETQEKYMKQYENNFYCPLLKYLMNLDYKSLLFDCIKDGYNGCEIVNHPKLVNLSVPQKQLCYKAIYNTLQEQCLLDKNLDFAEWNFFTSYSNKYLLYLFRDSSTSWKLAISNSYLTKDPHTGGARISGGTLQKLLPTGTHFISGHTL